MSIVNLADLPDAVGLPHGRLPSRRSKAKSGAAERVIVPGATTLGALLVAG
jgi:hypothetical protein